MIQQETEGRRVPWSCRTGVSVVLSIAACLLSFGVASAYAVLTRKNSGFLGLFEHNAFRLWFVSLPMGVTVSIIRGWRDHRAHVQQPQFWANYRFGRLSQVNRDESSRNWRAYHSGFVSWLPIVPLGIQIVSRASWLPFALGFFIVIPAFVGEYRRLYRVFEESVQQREQVHGVP